LCNKSSCADVHYLALYYVSKHIVIPTSKYIANVREENVSRLFIGIREEETGE